MHDQRIQLSVNGTPTEAVVEARLTLAEAAEEQTELQLRLAEVRDQRLADRSGAATGRDDPAAHLEPTHE